MNQLICKVLLEERAELRADNSHLLQLLDIKETKINKINEIKKTSQREIQFLRAENKKIIEQINLLCASQSAPQSKPENRSEENKLQEIALQPNQNFANGVKQRESRQEIRTFAKKPINSNHLPCIDKENESSERIALFEDQISCQDVNALKNAANFLPLNCNSILNQSLERVEENDQFDDY